MTTYIDNSTDLSNTVKITAPPKTLKDSDVSSSEPMFNNPVNSSTATSNEPQAPKVRKIEIKKIDKKNLVKKYKDNPIGIIQELGIEFSPEELEKLQGLLKDKKSLQILVNIIDKKNLSPKDIIAALEHELKRKGSWFGKRLFIRITEGRSEHEIKADNFSEEMSEVRESRQDLSTNTVVSVADANETTPENKENVMHFVEAKRTNGAPIYSDDNVNTAVGYIQEHPDNADELVSVTTELENITDENGVPKYTGTTMLNVGIRSTENPKLKETNLRVAHKSDMTDEYLENITKNLFENPDMQGVINFSLDAKTQDGSDKFSASNINDESNQLVHQELEYCNSYLENLQTLSQYGNLSSDDIVTITQNITAHPEIYNDVISKINSGTMSSSEIAEYSSQCAQAAENESYVSTSTQKGINITSDSNNNDYQYEYKQNTEVENKDNTLPKTNAITNKKDNPIDILLNNCEISDKDEQNSDTVIQIDGKNYSKDKIEEVLYRQFGTLSKGLLNKIISDPSFVKTIKKYSGNKVILEAIIKNPDLIDKINSAAGSLSNKERAEILSLCTDTNSTNIMLMALETSSVTDAIRTTKMARITNSKDDTLSILTARNKSNSNKRKELEQLYGINNNCSYVA